MTTFTLFTYSKVQLDRIRTQVRDDLGVDVDQTTRRSMEVAASAYLPHGAINRQRPSRKELIALREDAKNLRARISGSLSVHLGIENVGPHTIPQRGVDGDMMDATDDYFTKLIRNLDRMIDQSATHLDNSRKTEREEFWSQLLAIWCDIGGQPSGVAAANFVALAASPVGAGANLRTVVKWLERRQSKSISKFAKPERRRAAR